MYKFDELNSLVTSCSNNLLSGCKSTTCQQIASYKLGTTWLDKITAWLQTCWQACYKLVASTTCWQLVRFWVGLSRRQLRHVCDTFKDHMETRLKRNKLHDVSIQGPGRKLRTERFSKDDADGKDDVKKWRDVSIYGCATALWRHFHVVFNVGVVFAKAL